MSAARTRVSREAARLYVRAAGPPALRRPRRFVGELPAGTWLEPLEADGVAFELVGAGPADAPPELATDGADAEALDRWVRAWATMRCVAGAPGGVEPRRRVQLEVRPETQLRAGEEVELAAGQVAGSAEPLWLVADAPVLRAAGVGDDGWPLLAVLPSHRTLGVECTAPAKCRASSSAELLEQLGAEPVTRAFEQAAAAIASWFQRAVADEDARNATTGERDDEILQGTFEVISHVVARRAPRELPVSSESALRAVVERIARREGIALVPPQRDAEGDGTLEERLRRLATSSSFRFRAVELGGEWWGETGPSLLLVRVEDGAPAAALWEPGGFRLAGEDGSLHPIDAELAARFEPAGYMLYAALPHETSRAGLARFSLFGSGGDLGALLYTGLLATVLGLVVPIATGLIVGTAIPDGRTNLLAQMVVLAGAATAGSAAFTLARSLATLRLSSRMDLRLQSALWDRVLRLPPEFFRRFTTGDLTTRVLAADRVRRLVTGSVLGGLLGGLFAAVSLALMLVYDLRLALYGFGFALVAITLLAWVSFRQIRYLTIYRDEEGEVSSRIVGLLGGISKLRLAAAEERAFARWGEPFVRQQRAMWRGGLLRAGQRVANSTLPALGILGMMAVAGLRTVPMELSAFAAFNTAFGQFLAALGGLSAALASGLQAIPVARRARPVLQARPEVEETRTDPGTLTGQVEVRGLSFAYPGSSRTVLRGLDLAIEPGEFLAVVGRSGCGKSTLLRLLLGFETPTEGAVLYDEQDLATLDLRRVRGQIGTVLQHSGLVPGSLFENIAGSAPLSDEEVMEAVRLAGLEEDVRRLPMGLETFVAEDGGTLSGGQRQRIMIARALVKRPSILFFDEATSALDNRTQAIVSASLEELEVTRMVIAHRLSTIRNADRIVVLSEGRVAEAGRFQELMDLRGEFYELARRQLA